MLHFLLVFLVLIVLLSILIASVYFGRWFGYLQLKRHPHHKLEVVGAAETSVFGLLALLIAFTFSGAYERFENRKIHLLNEANAYATALHYTDVLAPQYQTELKDKIRNYINLHLDAYHEFPFIKRVRNTLDQALTVERQIWQLAITAAKENSNASLAQSFIEAIDNMFNTARIGMNLAKVHPPGIIFLLMISIAALGAFLIGYDSTENKHKRPLHIFCYILLTAITIYIIVNLEFPRTGFIQFAYFDQMIMDVRDNTNNAYSAIFPF